MIKNLSAFWLTVILLTTFSCKSKELFPEFQMGMAEDNWKSNEKKFEAQGRILYSWNLGAADIETQIALNGDGIEYGPLRLISINLATKKVVSNESNDFANAICSIVKLDSVLLYLENKFGKPDSITYKTHGIGDVFGSQSQEDYSLRLSGGKTTFEKFDSLSRLAGIDTTECSYYFHNNSSTILVKKGKMMSPTADIPYGFYGHAHVYEISTLYEKDLSSVIQSRILLLKPNDVVTVPIYTMYTNETTSYMNEANERRLYLTAVIDNPNLQFVALEEKRSIKSIKGRIVIKDNHGDSLLCYPEFKLELLQPLKRAYRPGLQFAMGEYGIFGEPFIETRRTVFARVDNPSTPPEFRRAFERGEKFTAVFVPESILFTDGTILK